MKKFLYVILFLLLAGFFVMYFNKNTSQDTKTVIKFSSWGSQSETTLIIPLIKDFERQNPDIKVEFIHIPQNYFQKLHLLFASNLAPDVVFINNYYAPKYIKAGLLEDLTPYINIDDYFKTSVQSFTYDNKIYVIPRDISNLVIYYNKDLFKKYKIPLPKQDWTLDDYLNIAKTFADKGIWGTSFESDVLFWLPYLMSNGASILSYDGTKVLLKENASIEALQFYSNLANKYKVAPQKKDSASLTMAQLFLQQRIAMHLSGRWLVPKYREEADFDWDIVPFPRGTAGSVVNIDSSGYALSVTSKQKKEALRFIEFISSSSSLAKLTSSGLIIPARKDVAFSESFLDKTKRPYNAKIFLDIINTGKPTPVNANYQKITDILNIALEPLFLGKEKARNIINDELLIDLSRYAY